jgi:hypothetical protein
MGVISWARPIMSTKLVAAVTDDGSVRSATVNEQRTLTSARAKARRRLHVSPVFPNRSSIALYLRSLPPPPLLLLSPTNEPTVPDVNMCQSGLKRSKTKHCAILGVHIKNLPCGESAIWDSGPARSRAWPCTAHGMRCPIFSSSQVPAWRDDVVRGYMSDSPWEPHPAVINRSIDCPPCPHLSFLP